MPVCYTQTCSRDFQETLLAVRSKVFFPYFKMLKNKDEKSGWRTPGSALSAPLEFSLYLSKADVPGRMHTAARGEDGGVQDLNTFHCSSHILFTHSCWPRNNTGKKKGREGGYDRKEQLIGVMILTPLLQCCRFVVLSTSPITRNVFSAALAGADRHAVSCHRERERKREGKIHYKKRRKKKTLHLQRPYTFSAIQQQVEEKTQLKFTELTFVLKSWMDF